MSTSRTEHAGLDNANTLLSLYEGERVMKIEVLVEGEGLQDIEIVQVDDGSLARELVVAIATRGDFSPEECFLFLEDCDETLDLAEVLNAEQVSGKIHHVHRIQRVDVTVFYLGHHKERTFSPSTRIQRVLDWAVGPHGFHVDPAIAPEMELALHGQTTALPKNAHLGRFIKHPHHSIKFDLIRGVVPNGCSHDHD